MALRINIPEALHRFREHVVEMKEADFVSEALEEIISYHLAALASVSAVSTTAAATNGSIAGSAVAVTVLVLAAVAADASFWRKCAILCRMLAAGLKCEKLLTVIVALNFDNVGHMADDALEGLFRHVMRKMGPMKCMPIVNVAARRVQI
jgi:hypothetical protein